MASEDDRKINEILQSHGLKETFDMLQKHLSDISSKKYSLSVRARISFLKKHVLEVIKNPQKTVTAIGGLLSLAALLLPYPFSIPFSIAAGLLKLFQFLSRKSSKMKVIEELHYLDDDTWKKTFAVQSALSSSLHFLQRTHQRKLNDEEIKIIQAQVPPHTGTEFLGELKYKIQKLQSGNSNKQNEKNEEKETEKETLKRCVSVIALCDLFCVLSILREFVMYYLVTILSNNNVSETITESYLERQKYFKTEREEILKVLYEPDPKDAGIAAVFEPSKWPKLSEQLNSRSDFSHVIDRPLKIVSVLGNGFEVFRYSPDITKAFKLTRYVRVMENSGTKFVLKSEGNQDFTIHLSEKPEITWNIKGDEVQATQTKPSDPSDLSDHFNIVRLSNGNFMFSSRARPTCFIKMEKAQNDARLTVVNNGFEESCQWKLIT